MEYTIEKFKVKEGFPTLTYLQTAGQIISRHEASFMQSVHPDLVEAMNKLTVHLSLLTELVKEFELKDHGHLAMAMNGNNLYDDPAFLSFKCTGFSLSSEGVVLIGRKNLSTKKVLNLVSPFTFLNEDSDYAYYDHLQNAIDAAIAEAELMLTEGKFGSTQQLDLFNQAEEKEEAA